jgi:hypothetical protein
MDYHKGDAAHWDHRRHQGIPFVPPFLHRRTALGVPGEINIALVGHTDLSVNGKYGAKDKVVRFRHRLAEAVASVVYAGLELSHLASPRAAQGHQGAHAPPRR